MRRPSTAALGAALAVVLILPGAPAGAGSHVPPAWLKCGPRTVPTQIGVPGVTTGKGRRRWVCLNPGPNPGLKCKPPRVARFVHNDKTGYGYWSCVRAAAPPQGAYGSRGGGVRK